MSAPEDTTKSVVSDSSSHDPLTPTGRSLASDEEKADRLSAGVSCMSGFKEWSGDGNKDWNGNSQT